MARPCSPGKAAVPICPVGNIVEVGAEASGLHKLDPIAFEDIFVALPELTFRKAQERSTGGLARYSCANFWTESTPRTDKFKSEDSKHG